jgi:hypothetical protein
MSSTRGKKVVVTIIGSCLLLLSSSVALSMVSNTTAIADKKPLGGPSNAPIERVQHGDNKQRDKIKESGSLLSENYRQWNHTQNQNSSEKKKEKEVSNEAANKKDTQSNTLKVDLSINHSVEINDYIKRAELALEAKEYENALVNIKQAQMLDPTHSRANNLFKTIYKLYSEEITQKRDKLTEGSR